MIENQNIGDLPEFTPGEQAVIVACFIVGFALIYWLFYRLLNCPRAEISNGDDDIIYRENTSNEPHEFI